MNWKEEYKRKVSTPAKAIKDIHDGQCVVMGHAAAAPRVIQEELSKHCEDYSKRFVLSCKWSVVSRQ